MTGRTSMRIRENRPIVQPTAFPTGPAQELQDDLYDNEFDADEPVDAEAANSLDALKLPLTVSTVDQNTTPSAGSSLPSRPISVIRSLISGPSIPISSSSYSTKNVENRPPVFSTYNGSQLNAILNKHVIRSPTDQYISNSSISRHTLPTASFSTTPSHVKRPRGRPRKYPLPSTTEPNTRQTHVRAVSSEPESILISTQNDYPPIDFTQPVLKLGLKHDPFHSLDADGDSVETGATTSSIRSSVSPSTVTTSIASTSIGRMKTSVLGKDFDIEKLKKCRRLNGYTIFVMVNRHKYETGSTGPGDDGTDTAEGSPANAKETKKWQAIWSTLPEKTRKQWKTRARRLINQQHQQPSKLGRRTMTSDRRLNERRRLESQLAKAETVSAELRDLAAYFQLLSESFASMAGDLNAHQGPVDIQGVCSTLLDGLLSCLVPLTALASHESALSSVSRNEDIINALKHLTYIIPL